MFLIFNLVSWSTKDGLLDLRASIVDDWSPVRSDTELKLFVKSLSRHRPFLSRFFDCSIHLAQDERYLIEILFSYKNFTIR